MTFAPGKIILTGEHSVVYGKPAIALAIDKGIETIATRFEGSSYCTGPVVDETLWKAIRTIVPEYGFKITFRSSLPVGKGMGSSAALSVSLCREMARIQSQDLSLKALLEQAMKMETFFHGRPSGLDHTVSALGKAVLFQKTTTGTKWDPIDFPTVDVLIVDSGTTGSTAEMVAKVAMYAHTAKFQSILSKMEMLSMQIVEAITLNDFNLIGQLCTQNHQYLKELGVSTPAINDIVDSALELGAWGAKLSGSGGGGIVMILGDELSKLKRYYVENGYDAFITHSYSTTESSIDKHGIHNV